MSDIKQAIQTHDPLYRPMLIGLMVITFIPFVLGVLGADFSTLGDAAPVVGEIYDPGESVADAHHQPDRGPNSSLSNNTNLTGKHIQL